jgi:hypothetical protein
MTLTEEQREAIRVISKLPMAIGCQLCHPYIMENYGSHFIVLRDMIDSSGTVEPTGGFDLEKARAADEALPYPLDANEIWVSGKGQMHINPPNAPSIFFTLSDLCEFRNLFHGQAAEIERLRASLIDLHAEYINTLEKNPGCSAWDLDEQSDADQRRLRKNAAHAISITEPPIYLQAEQLAARIKELEDAHKRSGAKYAKIINELRSSVYANIPGLDVGKIGPDAKPQSWQITEERIGLLEYCLETLLDAPDIEEIPGPGHSIEMLRAMLREAEQ